MQTATAAANSARLLGAYYTPDDVAGVLTRWAVNGRAGRVLDPSFGGASFLRAAWEEIVASDVGSAEEIVGVDIDPSAKRFTRELVAKGLPPDNIVIQDFFVLRPSNLGGAFEAVVGNPPWIRHQTFTGDTRTAAERACAELGFPVDRRSSSWVHFVVHATRFVRIHGRMAWVLPTSLIHSNYGGPVVRYLEMNFRQVHLIRIHERIFTNTLEEAIVVLADARGAGPARARFHDVQDRTALAALVRKLHAVPGAPAADAKLHLLTADERELWQQLAFSSSVAALGEVAKIHIGVVTGANHFFIRPMEQVRGLVGRGVRALPIVTRARELSGGSCTPTVARKLNRLLIIEEDAPIDGNLAEAIQAAESENLHKRYHCLRRDRWFAISDTERPDAFLPYMAATPPSVYPNASRATSSNSVHRVWWRGRQPAKALVVASWTSAFALSIELAGRSYGGGVLKLEPGEAARALLPRVSSAGRYARRLDAIIREQGALEARRFADRVVLHEGLGLPMADIHRLRDAQMRLEARRRTFN